MRIDKLKKFCLISGIITLWICFKNNDIIKRRKILRFPQERLPNQYLRRQQFDKAHPHILFIIADDLGYNDVGYHGSEINTPNLDALALSGVRLENYYVQPVCTPTRGQLLSGRYQIHTCLHWVLWPATPSGLALDNPTITDKLRDAGYATHMVGKWHLGFFKPDYLPTNRGFDSFFGFLSGHSDYFTHITTNFQNTIMSGFDLMDNDQPANIKQYNGTYSTHLFEMKVIDIIQKHDIDKPLFIYISFQAVHAPLQVPETYLKPYENINDTNRRNFAGMVSCMDEAIGNIVEAMKKDGLWDNTLMIFSTDNGANPKVGGSNFPLRGKKSTFWEGGIRAVGFVHSPILDKGRRGHISRELIHVTDWFPTLLNLAGGDLNGTNGLDGFDQWNSLKNDVPSPRKEILHDIDPAYNTTNKSSFRMGGWKILTGQRGQTTNKDNTNICLFNIEKDPLERNDISEEYPYVVQKMLRRIEDYRGGMVSCQNPEPDQSADPKYHDGFWQPWK